MTEKIQVVLITPNLILNGISTVVSSYCDNLPKDQYDITILAGSEIDRIYQKRYEGTNVKIIECPSKSKDPKGYYTAIYKYLRNNRADIVHIHGNSAVCVVELMIAMVCGVKKRVMHCHNTTCDHIKLHKLLRPILNALCTDRCACGEAAGRWLYGNKTFTVIPNAFHTERFRFGKAARDEIRNELGLEGKTVIGHVGLFNYQKNHEFLLKIFDAYAAAHKDACLLLVGEGTGLAATQSMAEKMVSGDRVIFYGATGNTAPLYSAMDAFVMPSRFEGLPLVLLEAQISGLPCIVSDVITQEVGLDGDMQSLSLKESPAVWAEHIHTASDEERTSFCEAHKDAVSRYEISSAVGVLDGIYRGE